MIRVESLSFSYGDHPVLKDISFDAKKGEFLSILGSNGVGKSTLFRCILGLLPGYSGSIYLDGKDIRSLRPRQMAKLAAYIPQNTASVYNFSVADIVLMGATAWLSPLQSPGKKEKERAEWAMDKVGIAHLKDRCFHHLSGGEKQLAVLARALVQNAKVLMLDEPTASLDFANQLLVLTEVRRLSHEGYTVIQTTHNPEHAYTFSDRILTLKDGEVFCSGRPDEVIVPEVIGSLYEMDVEVSSLYDDRVRVCTPSFLTHT
ncbi:MAG: ABC transporter ATP-binding protein [Solobacterium sp.]|nr:ABC transporter ATP-binding protein [Solobacterium sp.]